MGERSARLNALKPDLGHSVPLSYRALVFAAAFPALLYTLSRALRDGGRNYLAQRYARKLPTDLKGRTCLHCCSVGEVRAILPLARELRENGLDLFISVGTPTGWRMARSLLARIPCVYFPLDHPSVVRRWLDRLAPKAILVMETELWPNFFHAAGQRDIPIALVNARLSRRTQIPPLPLRSALRQAAQQLRCILARGDKDADRFASLGAPTERIENLGNIKHAATLDDLPDDAPIDRPYILAASTHKDEEKQIARLWKKLHLQGPLLVLMPRYPDRAPEIMRHLEALDLRVGLHTRDRQPGPNDQVYLADTLGEAPWWMRHAAFVFLGGSLVPRGGHNVMEPAMLGKACVVGPHSDNFEAEVQGLLACGGLRQARDIDELGQVFSQWLAHPREAHKTGLRAQARSQGGGQLIKRYIEALRRYSMLD